MKIANCKAVVSIILMLTIAVSIVAVAPISAQDTDYYTTWLYVGTSAGTRGVGVGETILLVAWTAEMPPDIGEASGTVSSPTGRPGWYGMQIELTDPDGTVEILDMPYSDPVGANYIAYTPTQAGTYEIKALFAYTEKVHQETTYGYGGANEGDIEIFSEAESPVTTFEVYEGSTPKWVESPLPNGYWTRPISDAAREWYTLAGNWLSGAANQWPPGSAGGNISPYAYGEAPESAHILWSKPFFIGGLMDERWGSINFHTEHYQGVSFSPNVILDGKIHWSPRYTTHGDKGWQIIDLYTGETLYTDWDKNAPSMGSIYLYESPNQHGGFAYLWETGGGGFFFGGGSTVEVPEIIQVTNSHQEKAGLLPVRDAPSSEVNRTETPISLGTVYKMIDAYTFKDICWIANVSTSGTQVYGKDGSILRYNTVNYGTSSAPDYYITVWNSSCGTMLSSQTGTGAWQWRPAGGTFGGSNPYLGGVAYNYVHDGNQMWWGNFSCPDVSGGSIRCVREGEYIIVGTQGQNDKNDVEQGWMMGISLEDGHEGAQLWKTTFTPPFIDLDKNITAAGMFTGGFSLTGVYPEAGVFTFGDVKQLKTWVYDLNTGTELWQTGDETPQYNYYGQSQIMINGILIIYGRYGGAMQAYNATTGELVWTYSAEGIGEESPYGNYPLQIQAVAGDKIYTASWEHSYTHPLVRGPNLRCINATDGTEVWSILDFGPGAGIADGRLVSSNSMDNMIYCYGRGPSGTTVTASPKVSVHGSQVLVEGTVTDQTTTGRRTTNDIIDFTLQGTPAISDEYMSAWMEYMFMQQAYPADAQGVEVTLTVVDPNSNIYEIGTATSDIEGNYALPFEPLVPGCYQIIAQFDGSASYGPSSATTYLMVEEAPAATPMPTPPPASVADMYLLPSVAGIIVAIVVIGIVIILMLRRR